MKLTEITQLDEIRRQLHLIVSELTLVQRIVERLHERTEKVYFDACAEFNEDGECNREASYILKQIETPLSMKMKVPDAAYACECGDDCAQKLVSDRVIAWCVVSRGWGVASGE